MSLKERLRNGCERRYRVADIPLIGKVRIRSLLASEIRSLKNSLRTPDGKVDELRWGMLDELLIANTIVDDDGNLEFTEADALHGALEMDGGARSVLMEEIKGHTGFVADSEWKPIEDKAKN